MILQSLRKDGLMQVCLMFEQVDIKYKTSEKRLLEYGWLGGILRKSILSFIR